MTNDKHPWLAREGRAHVAVAVVLAVVAQATVGGIAAAFLWLVVVFVVQFFRDPPRAIPTLPGAVVAPADGAVIAVGDAYDPYLKRDAKRISIFMNVFNVHSNWIPVEGTVMEAWYHRGRFLNAALDKASEANERNALWIRTDAGADIVVVQVAGLIARRILCYARPQTRVARGSRYGFIRFGSRVDLYLPPESTVHAALGDTVSAGTDIVAELLPASP